MIRERIIKYLGELRFPYLVAMTATVFFVNLLVPDLLPYVDEILLALATVILARIKKRVVPRSDAADFDDDLTSSK